MENCSNDWGPTHTSVEELSSFLPSTWCLIYRNLPLRLFAFPSVHLIYMTQNTVLNQLCMVAIVISSYRTSLSKLANHFTLLKLATRRLQAYLTKKITKLVMTIYMQYSRYVVGALFMVPYSLVSLNILSGFHKQRTVNDRSLGLCSRTLFMDLGMDQYPTHNQCLPKSLIHLSLLARVRSRITLNCINYNINRPMWFVVGLAALWEGYCREQIHLHGRNSRQDFAVSACSSRATCPPVLLLAWPDCGTYDNAAFSG